jgi:hypothetical protein
MGCSGSPILETELYKYTLSKAIDRYVLAASERNHRVLLIRVPVNPPNSQLSITLYECFFKRLTENLRKRGFKIEVPSKAPSVVLPEKNKQFLVVLGP